MDEPTAVLAPAGGRGAVRDAPVDDRRRPERRLHQPQARRGPRDRRPDHGHAARARSPPPGVPAAGATKADLARLMVGRSVLEIARADAVRARARSSSRSSGVVGRQRPGPAGAARRLARRPGGRDRRHRGGRRQRPERARRGHHRAAAVPGRGHCRRPGPWRTGPPATAIRRGRRARARGPDRRRQRPEPVAHRQPDHEALPRRARSPAAGSSTTTPRRAIADRAARTPTRSRRPSIDTQVRLLSGGNLQRLILAREIDDEARAARRRPADARPRRRGDRDASTGCCSSCARRARRSC